jgi:hypothetical protein
MNTSSIPNKGIYRKCPKRPYISTEPVAVDVAGPPPVDLLFATRVDIALSDGSRVLIEGPTSLLAVVGLVQRLSI